MKGFPYLASIYSICNLDDKQNSEADLMYSLIADDLAGKSTLCTTRIQEMTPQKPTITGSCSQRHHRIHEMVQAAAATGVYVIVMY